jgi:hypothetical protein
MTKNIAYSFAFLLWNSVSTFGQLGIDMSYNPPKKPIEFEKLGLKGYENRFFYDDKYHQGELWTTNGHYTTEMQYRFNQLEGTIQVKLPNDKEILLDEKSVIMFHLFIQDKNEEKKIIFVQETLPQNNKKALLQVLYDGTNFQLLRDTRKSFSINLYYETADQRLNYTYYIAQGTKKPLHVISLTEKSLTQTFPTKHTKIKQFFKSYDSKEKMNLTKILQLMTNLDEES